MRELVQKPGTLWRATGAFVLLNAVLLVTLFLIVTIAPTMRNVIWLQAIAALLVAALEFAIVMCTIQDPLNKWVKGEHYVDVPESPRPGR